jgi:hypothetical protein
VNAGTALCLWLLGRRVMSAAWAALAPLLYAVLVVVGFPGLTMFNYSPLSLVFALFALLFLLRHLEAPRRVDGIAAGLLLAGCALTKQNFGALTLLAFLVVILASWREGALAGRGGLRSLWPVAAAGGVESAAALAALVLAGAGPALIDASLFALGRTQIESYADPFPPILGPHPIDDGRFVFLYTPRRSSAIWYAARRSSDGRFRCGCGAARSASPTAAPCSRSPRAGCGCGSIAAQSRRAAGARRARWWSSLPAFFSGSSPPRSGRTSPSCSHRCS